MAFDPWQEIRRHEAAQRQAGENSARMATCTGFVDSTGLGEAEYDDEIRFGVTYVEEPSVSYGHALSDDGPELEEGLFPRCTGGVSRWRRDTRGFYIGCWPYVVVDAPDGAPAYVVNHYFTFSGIAMKILPDDLLAL